MSKLRIIVVSTVLLCTGAASSLWAQVASGTTSAAVPRPDAQPAAPAPSENLGADPVGSGDLVYISVEGAPELTRSYRISNDGQLSLPLVKEPISVAGMAPSALAHAVTEALVRDKILVAPIVSAAVLEYKSREVTITGEVKAPSVIPATGHFKLTDAITRAQGLNPTAGPEIVVIRRAATGGGKETIRIPTRELLSGTKPDLDIALQGGEMIRVVEAPKIFITGNVRAPGIFPLVAPEGTTVLKAMAAVQGTLPSTSKQAYVYRAVDGSEKRKAIRVPLQAILDGKSPDFRLQANDILYVPPITKSPFDKVLEHLLGFGEATGSGLILAHGI